MKIPQKHIKFYKKNGYLILANVLSKKEINILSKKLDQLESTQKNDRQGLAEPGVKKSLIHSLHKEKIIYNYCESKDWFQQYSKALLDSKEFLVWNAKSNLKKRWHGSAEYYHQDFQYWKEYGFKSDKMMSCMIFPDNHLHYNGGMWIFPQSHKKLYKHEKFLNINSLQKNLIPMNILEKLNKKNKVLQLNIKAGSCLFFHCKLVHGSAHNISPIDRRIILYQLSAKEGYDANRILKVNQKNLLKRKEFEKKNIKLRLSSYN